MIKTLKVLDDILCALGYTLLQKLVFIMRKSILLYYIITLTLISINLYVIGIAGVIIHFILVIAVFRFHCKYPEERFN